MKGQKQSKTEVLQNKVQALTNVIKQLITEIQANASLAQGTLTAFQMYIGKDEWEKIVEQLKEKEKLDNELE
jgi:protein involved in temperature-dependent protein secretion|tara:strand:- start:52 stop:267 length:216 start_codon:yes stop_codon:yes gene_type:complete